MDHAKDKALQNVGDFSIRTICVRITMKGFPIKPIHLGVFYCTL